MYWGNALKCGYLLLGLRNLIILLGSVNKPFTISTSLLFRTKMRGAEVGQVAWIFFVMLVEKKNLARDIKVMMTNAVAYVQVCAPFVVLIQPMQCKVLFIFFKWIFCTALKLSCLLWFIVVRSLFHTTHY